MPVDVGVAPLEIRRPLAPPDERRRPIVEVAEPGDAVGPAAAESRVRTRSRSVIMRPEYIPGPRRLSTWGKIGPDGKKDRLPGAFRGLACRPGPERAARLLPAGAADRGAGRRDRRCPALAPPPRRHHLGRDGLRQEHPDPEDVPRGGPGRRRPHRRHPAAPARGHDHRRTASPRRSGSRSGSRSATRSASRTGPRATATSRS